MIVLQNFPSHHAERFFGKVLGSYLSCKRGNSLKLFRKTSLHDGMGNSVCTSGIVTGGIEALPAPPSPGRPRRRGWQQTSSSAEPTPPRPRHHSPGADFHATFLDTFDFHMGPNSTR